MFKLVVCAAFVGGALSAASVNNRMRMRFNANNRDLQAGGSASATASMNGSDIMVPDDFDPDEILKKLEEQQQLPICQCSELDSCKEQMEREMRENEARCQQQCDAEAPVSSVDMDMLKSCHEKDMQKMKEVHECMKDALPPMCQTGNQPLTEVESVGLPMMMGPRMEGPGSHGPPHMGGGPPMMEGGPPMPGGGPPMMGGGPPMRGGRPPMMGGGPPMMGSGPPMSGGGPTMRGEEQGPREAAQPGRQEHHGSGGPFNFMQYLPEDVQANIQCMNQCMESSRPQGPPACFPTDCRMANTATFMQRLRAMSQCRPKDAKRGQQRPDLSQKLMEHCQCAADAGVQVDCDALKSEAESRVQQMINRFQTGAAASGNVNMNTNARVGNSNVNGKTRTNFGARRRGPLP